MGIPERLPATRPDTMTDPRAHELVEVVSRRLDVLATLDEPKHKRDLVAALDLSRSTLDRAVRELDAHGLVAREDGYRRTVTGRIALELFQELLADLEATTDAGELLRPLPQDAPMSPAMLRGATVYVAEPPSPTAVLDPLLELYEDAERLRGFSAARSRPEIGDRFYDLLTEEGVQADTVYDASLVEHVVENDDRYDELLSLESLQLRVHPDLPYSLVVVTGPDGETAFVVLYDDDASLRGCLVNDSTDACRWAEEVFERYRAEAEPLDD